MMLAEITELELADFTSAYGTPAKEHIEALVVDSDAFDCVKLVHIAARSQQLDIGVTACRSLADAGAALAHQHYDVIYLEYWLGDETTIAFIHEMTGAGTPCIVLTDLNEPDIRRIAFRAGAQAFLAKDSLGPQALESVTLAVLRPQLCARAAA
jgi:CheY-like chemotaxis protein